MEDFKEIKLGEKIPDLTMQVYLPEKKQFDENFKINDILSKKKWVILFFYPADYTFVCPTELADIGDKYKDFQAANAEIISVSTDTHFVHLAWQQSESLLKNIKYPMGADPTHSISKIFGVLDAGSGLALRGTFIIDPDGVLRASEINYYPVGRSADELYRKFLAFKHVSENPTHACPAKWKPGDKTLTPGADLVGKVGDALK